MHLSAAACDRLTQVVHLYLAVADTRHEDLEPHERQLAIFLSRRWEPTFDLDAVEAVLDTAYAAARSGLNPSVDEIASELSHTLPPEGGRRLLKDLGLMARADGHLTRQEAEVIGQVRSALMRPRLAKAA